MIPLYCIADGGKFKIPGKKRVFTKKNNLATIYIRDERYLTGESLCTHITEPACNCKNSSGRTFVKRWWDFVEEVN
jgi:hypothetical protein